MVLKKGLRREVRRQSGDASPHPPSFLIVDLTLDGVVETTKNTPFFLHVPYIISQSLNIYSILVEQPLVPGQMRRIF
jgi:hypothetical protein